MKPQPGARAFGAFGASILTHAGLLLILLAMLAAPQTDPVEDPVMSASLRYVHLAGIGGGGGGSDRPRVNPEPESAPAAPAQTVEVPVPAPLSIIATSFPPDIPGTSTGLSSPIALAPGNPGGTGSQPGTGAGPGKDGGVGPGRGGNTGGDEYAPGDNVTIPVVIYEKPPTYTVEAVRARIQGLVVLEAVVLANGTLAHPRIITSLDPGLDRRALDAVQQWRFKPGRRRDTNEPVNVRVTFQLAFQLR